MDLNLVGGNNTNHIEIRMLWPVKEGAWISELGNMQKLFRCIRLP